MIVSCEPDVKHLLSSHGRNGHKKAVGSSNFVQVDLNQGIHFLSQGGDHFKYENTSKEANKLTSEQKHSQSSSQWHTPVPLNQEAHTEPERNQPKLQLRQQHLLLQDPSTSTAVVPMILIPTAQLTSGAQQTAVVPQPQLLSSPPALIKIDKSGPKAKPAAAPLGSDTSSDAAKASTSSSRTRSPPVLNLSSDDDDPPLVIAEGGLDPGVPSSSTSSGSPSSADALDYAVHPDGSCTCKLCGELVASRTHWYRHKYKVHNVSLFRCNKCEIFFKSKKGYEGHVQNRHAPKLVGVDGKPKSKKEREGLNKVLKEIQSKKEAELVQKIIAQVKAECEAKGADINRRGYTKHY